MSLGLMTSISEIGTRISWMAMVPMSLSLGKFMKGKSGKASKKDMESAFMKMEESMKAAGAKIVKSVSEKSNSRMMSLL